MFCCELTLGQELPKRIRGYKVHRAEVSVNGSKPKARFKIQTEFGNPQVKDFGLRGIRFSLNTAMTVSGRSGTVDFISFKDFRFNGIPVSIDEYRNGFDFKKDHRVPLKEPIEVRISASSALRGAYLELRDSKEKWRVTGRIFVFGRFKRFGFKFRRVVPVDVDFEMPNPVGSALRATMLNGNLCRDASVVDEQRSVGLKGLSTGLLRQFG